MEIKSNKIKIEKVANIKPHPKNNNIHPKEQIEELKKQIKYQGFRDPLVISNLSGYLISGHARLEVAKEIGAEEIPVIYQDFVDEAQEYAYLTAANTLPAWAILDMSAIRNDILEFGEDFNVEFLGLQQSLDIKLDPEPSKKKKVEFEIDLDKIGDDLDCECPKCGFKFKGKK